MPNDHWVWASFPNLSPSALHVTVGSTGMIATPIICFVSENNNGPFAKPYKSAVSVTKSSKQLQNKSGLVEIDIASELNTSAVGGSVSIVSRWLRLPNLVVTLNLSTLKTTNLN